MISPAKQTKLEKRKLEKLLPFPLQATYYDPLSEHDLAALADDIRRNGLRQPIEILPRNAAGHPPNTILRGHQRQLALLLNGETEVDVLVRYDLAQASAEKIERAFHEDNQNRRHLDPLAKARVARRLYEIERGKSGENRRQDEDGELRDRVGKAIGMSGRNLARYLRVLQTPIEVQNAFRAGEVSLVAAEKVADIKPAAQAKLAKRIAAGEPAKKVISDAVQAKRPSTARGDGVVAEFVRASLPSARKLLAQIEGVTSDEVERYLDEVRQLRTAVTLLIHAKYPVRYEAEAFEDD